MEFLLASLGFFKQPVDIENEKWLQWNGDGLRGNQGQNSMAGGCGSDDRGLNTSQDPWHTRPDLSEHSAIADPSFS
jgi:hypothetical protein